MYGPDRDAATTRPGPACPDPLPGGLPAPADADRGRPGGIPLRRDWRFRDLTGALELAVAEAAAGTGGGPAVSEPAQVTAVLAAALAEVCGAPASAERVRALSVGDRSFLMTRLAALLQDAPVWLTARCRACGEPFDCAYRDAQLPVKPAGAAYPATTLETSVGPLSVRVPTGADQEDIATAADDAGARRRLLRRLLRLRADLDPERLDPADLAAIDAAVETLSPELGTTLVSNCPECGAQNHIHVDPHRALGHNTEGLFAEIHTLARHYHWSEAEILALPSARRRTYLRFIDRERGLAAAPDVLATERPAGAAGP